MIEIKETHAEMGSERQGERKDGEEKKKKEVGKKEREDEPETGEKPTKQEPTRLDGLRKRGRRRRQRDEPTVKAKDQEEEARTILQEAPSPLPPLPAGTVRNGRREEEAEPGKVAG